MTGEKFHFEGGDSWLLLQIPSILVISTHATYSMVQGRLLAILEKRKSSFSHQGWEFGKSLEGVQDNFWSLFFI